MQIAEAPQIAHIEMPNIFPAHEAFFGRRTKAGALEKSVHCNLLARKSSTSTRPTGHLNLADILACCTRSHQIYFYARRLDSHKHGRRTSFAPRRDIVWGRRGKRLNATSLRINFKRFGGRDFGINSTHIVHVCHVISSFSLLNFYLM